MQRPAPSPPLAAAPSRARLAPLALVPLALLPPAVSCAGAPPDAPPALTPPVAPELQVRPLTDLYYEVRARAGARGAPPQEGPLSAAVAAARVLERSFGFPLPWGLVDGELIGCQTADDLVRACEALPETFTRREPGGGTRLQPLHEPAVALARALAAVEADWLTREWPPRRAALEAARAQLAARLQGPRAAALFEHFTGILDLHLARAEAPVLLVTRAPWPGAMTFRAPGGGGVSVVGLEGQAGSTLVEVALHEILHTLDELGADQETLLQRVRASLAAAGLSETDRRRRDAAHLLFFVHAADTVRRFVDPGHVDYGESAGLYARLGPYARVVRALWPRYVAGELDADGFVTLVTAAVLDSGP